MFILRHHITIYRLSTNLRNLILSPANGRKIFIVKEELLLIGYTALHNKINPFLSRQLLSFFPFICRDYECTDVLIFRSQVERVEVVLCLIIRRAIKDIS